MLWADLMGTIGTGLTGLFGSPILAGLFYTAFLMILLSKLGLGPEASIVLGAGFLIVMSVFMLGLGLVITIAVGIAFIIGLALLRLIRK